MRSKVRLETGQKINDWTMLYCPEKGKMTGVCKCGYVKTAWAYTFTDQARCRPCASRLTLDEFRNHIAKISNHLQKGGA